MKNLNAVHLNGLRAVEAVGRLGTLRAAADELNVTVGAVSQQVQKAELQLGRILFERSRKGLTPTAQGADILAHLTRGLFELSTAVSIARQTAENTLTVSVAPVFAGKWLVWRLQEFNAAHPGIRIRVDATVERADPNTSDVDICIRIGRGPWPNVRADKLIDHRVFPVCSPEMANRLRTVDDLARVPIIRDPHAMFGWNVWLDPNGLNEDILDEGPVFSDASLCLDAAVAGQGVFLAWETLACDGLAAGRLVEPFPGRYPTGNSYWFITAHNTRPTANTRAFERWLRHELAESIGVEA